MNTPAHNDTNGCEHQLHSRIDDHEASLMGATAVICGALMGVLVIAGLLIGDKLSGRLGFADRVLSPSATEPASGLVPSGNARLARRRS